MGAGVSGNQAASMYQSSTGAGRGRAFDELNDAAALRLLKTKSICSPTGTTVQKRGNGTSIQGRDRDILDALVELDARLDLTQYTQTAKLLTTGRRQQNKSIRRLDASVPQGDLLEAHSEQWRAMERVGLREVGTCAFVLVAGGLGERWRWDQGELSPRKARRVRVIWSCTFVLF